MENIYKGEITLIKIKDGAGINKVYDFYILGTSPEYSPTVPSINSTLEEITLSGWSQEVPSGFGKDYPVVWNFKRTEFGDGEVEHSEVVVASFWATAPEVMARYSATGIGDISTWDEIFNEAIHNYIIFSYDGGETWTPQGGIRIKGKVSVDEEAVIYSISTTQNEIIRYIMDETYQSSFSPGILNFQVVREYLGLVDTVDFVENFSETGEKEFQPVFDCQLVSRINSDQFVNINDILNADYIKKYETNNQVSILEYNYNQNKITFNFAEFVKAIELENSNNSDKINNQELYAQALQILNGIESYLKITINLIDKTNERKDVETNITIRYSTTYDLAKLSINADGIVQSIQNTKLVFNAEGLTVRNGGIKIYGDDFTTASPTAELFEQGEYYVLTDSGYVRAQPPFSEEIQYYEKTSYKAFGVDEFGNLYVKGIGEFSGKIYAQEGEFKGIVKAKSGYLENLTINGMLTVAGEDGHEIKIQGLYSPLENPENYQGDLYYYNEQSNTIEKYEGLNIIPEYDYYSKTDTPGIYTSNFQENGESGFWLNPTTGQIQANSIILGSGATIYDTIHFISEDGNKFGAIYNPNKHSGVFIEAGLISEEEDKKATLKITTDGNIFAGNLNNSNYIVIKGQEGIIQSGNYFSGGMGWRIDNTLAEFNDIIARGTLTSVNFKQGEISTISGGLLSRPSSVIKQAVLNEDQTVTLTLETKGIVFKEEDNESPYYFRIGSSTIAYLLEKEEIIDEDETVIVTVSSNSKKYGDVSGFVGQVLIGYGDEGDIGIGINSSNFGVGMPPRAISVFETVILEPETEGGEKLIRENPRIILGQINDKKTYGLSKYGLYADQVNVKGELTSKNDGLYTGINSNSTIKETTGENIIFWAGAQYEEIYKDDDEHIANSIQNAPFRVDARGNVYASSGYFSGEIHGSVISTSTLKAAVIEGIGPYYENDVAALTIRNAEKGIQFEDFFVLSNKEILSEVPFNIKEGTSIQKEGIITGFLSLSELLINNSLITIKANTEQELEILNDAGAINIFSSKGFYSKQNAYLDKNIYFGDETMEYRQIIENEETEKIIGYDLYIKS